MGYYEKTVDKNVYQNYLNGINRSGAVHVDSNYLPPYSSPIGTQNMTKHYEKVFSAADNVANDVNRYNKGDDEYWDEYINTVREERTDKIMEAKESNPADYTISVNDSDGRVNINMCRHDALLLMEEIGRDEMNVFNTVSGSVRRLLRDFFIKNEDVIVEDYPF
jgi:hypothetical protein